MEQQKQNTFKPVRCDKCQQQIKLIRASKPCHDFAAGKCTRGDGCSFSHDPALSQNSSQSTTVIANQSGSDELEPELMTCAKADCSKSFVIEDRYKTWCKNMKKDPWCSDCRAEQAKKRTSENYFAMFEPEEYEEAEDPECLA